MKKNSHWQEKIHTIHISNIKNVYKTVRKRPTDKISQKNKRLELSLTEEDIIIDQ